MSRDDWLHPDWPGHRIGPWTARRGASTAVVAAKTTEGIFRAINPVVFTTEGVAESLVRSILVFVGSLRPEVEWTAFLYPARPAYLHYGNAEGWPDERDIKRPSGVWLFRWEKPPSETYIGRTEIKGVLLGPIEDRYRR